MYPISYAVVEEIPQTETTEEVTVSLEESVIVEEQVEEQVAKEVHFDISQDFGELSERQVFNRWLVYVGWCVSYVIAGLLIGLMPATMLFLILYMRLQAKESWGIVLGVTLPLWIGYYLLFHVLLVVPIASN